MISWIRATFSDARVFGIKPTLDDCAIEFCKWFVGAESIKLSYPPARKGWLMTALSDECRTWSPINLSSKKQPCKHGSAEPKDGLSSAVVQPDNAPPAQNNSVSLAAETKPGVTVAASEEADSLTVPVGKSEGHKSTPPAPLAQTLSRTPEEICRAMRYKEPTTKEERESIVPYLMRIDASF